MEGFFMSIALNLMLLAGGICIIWGIIHILPIKSVIASFGPISQDNKGILLMEWISEGCSLIFIGILVIAMVFSAGYYNPATYLVGRLAGGMLLLLAALSVLNRIRRPPLFMKLSPVIKVIAGVLLLAGSTLPFT